MDTATLVPPFVAFVLMGLAHYVAERITHDQLHPIAAYIIGCIFGIILPYFLWTAMWEERGFDITYAAIRFELLLIIGCAGAGTIFAWGLDWKHGETLKHGKK